MMNATPAKRRKAGRPRTRTARTAALICCAVARGVPFGQAAAIAGISMSGLCAWRTRDATFEAAIQRAIARGVAAARDSTVFRVARRVRCAQSRHVVARTLPATAFCCESPTGGSGNGADGRSGRKTNRRCFPSRPGIGWQAGSRAHRPRFGRLQRAL